MKNKFQKHLASAILIVFCISFCSCEEKSKFAFLQDTGIFVDSLETDVIPNPAPFFSSGIVLTQEQKIRLSLDTLYTTKIVSVKQYGQNCLVVLANHQPCGELRTGEDGKIVDYTRDGGFVSFLLYDKKGQLLDHVNAGYRCGEECVAQNKIRYPQILMDSIYVTQSEWDYSLSPDNRIKVELRTQSNDTISYTYKVEGSVFRYLGRESNKEVNTGQLDIDAMPLSQVDKACEMISKYHIVTPSDVYIDYILPASCGCPSLKRFMKYKPQDVLMWVNNHPTDERLPLAISLLANDPSLPPSYIQNCIDNVKDKSVRQHLRARIFPN